MPLLVQERLPDFPGAIGAGTAGSMRVGAQLHIADPDDPKAATRAAEGGLVSPPRPRKGGRDRDPCLLDGEGRLEETLGD